MKTKKFITLVFLIIYGLVNGQNMESEIYVSYDMFLNFKNVVKYKGELVSNGEVGLFKYKISDDDLMYNEEQIDSESKVDITIIDSVTTYLYISKNDKIIIESRKGIHSKKTFFIKDSIPTINWNLTNETKIINGLLCKKASCNFNGRNYTAWYCPDIAINAGPWKLHGLPGIILEASDEVGQVTFTVKDMIFPHEEAIDSKVLYEKKYLTNSEFLKIQEMESEEFKARMATKFGRGVNVVLDYKIEGIEK